MEGSKSLSVAVRAEYFSGLEVMDDATMHMKFLLYLRQVYLQANLPDAKLVGFGNWISCCCSLYVSVVYSIQPKHLVSKNNRKWGLQLLVGSLVHGIYIHLLLSPDTLRTSTDCKPCNKAVLEQYVTHFLLYQLHPVVSTILAS